MALLPLCQAALREDGAGVGGMSPRCPVTCAPCAWLGACGDGGFWTPSSGGWFGAVIRPSPCPVVLCWPTCPNARGQMVGLHGRWLWEHRFPSRQSEMRNGARCLLAGGCGFNHGAGGRAEYAAPLSILQCPLVTLPKPAFAASPPSASRAVSRTL